MPNNRTRTVPVSSFDTRSTEPEGRPSENRVPAREVRILVADDHAVIRLGIIALLESQPGFHVVGEAASCLECCEKAAALKPDIVILDLEMGDCCGAQALKRLSKDAPQVRVLVFSAHTNDCLVSEIIRTGARGYVPKTASSRHLVDAVQTVCSGGAYLHPSISSLVIDRLNRRKGRAQEAALSARESSVLKLLAEGKRNKEIASTLFISERTVKFHVSSLLQKFEADNRTEVVKIAIGEGLVGG